MDDHLEESADTNPCYQDVLAIWLAKGNVILIRPGRRWFPKQIVANTLIRIAENTCRWSVGELPVGPLAGRPEVACCTLLANFGKYYLPTGSVAL